MLNMEAFSTPTLCEVGRCRRIPINGGIYFDGSEQKETLSNDPGGDPTNFKPTSAIEFFCLQL